VTPGFLADLVLVVHLGFVLFAALGGLAVARWPSLAWLHLPAVAWAATVELAGWTCPLTPLEDRLRGIGAGSAAGPGFVERTLMPVLYPERLTRAVQIGLGVGVLVLNAAVYAFVLRRRTSIARTASNRA
jgi:hypothetical protein